MYNVNVINDIIFVSNRQDFTIKYNADDKLVCQNHSEINEINNTKTG